jgi:hypothetical protein
MLPERIIDVRDWKNVLVLTGGILIISALIGMGVPMIIGRQAPNGLDATWQPPATTLVPPEPTHTVVPGSIETPGAVAAPSMLAAPAETTPTKAPTAARVLATQAATPGPESPPAATATALATATTIAVADGQGDEAPLAYFADIVKLHSDPDLASTTVGLAEAGTTYTITARTTDEAWWQVCCVKGQPAWVASTVVTVTGSAAGVTVVENKQ